MFKSNTSLACSLSDVGEVGNDKRGIGYDMCVRQISNSMQSEILEGIQYEVRCCLQMIVASASGGQWSVGPVGGYLPRINTKEIAAAAQYREGNIAIGLHRIGHDSLGIFTLHFQQCHGECNNECYCMVPSAGQ